jgi:3-phosphoshikimate 1-carboxyvinyltransferase
MTLTTPETLAITPLAVPPQATIAVPGSKSITNRALILAALAAGRSGLHGALASDDTRVMIDSLRRLGLIVDEQQIDEQQVDDQQDGASDLYANKNNTDHHKTVVEVEGQGGLLPATEAELFVGNSGTSVRFLTALVSLGRGCYHLDGVARMRQRPQGDLLTALQALGVSATSDAADGCPPLTVRGIRGLAGGTIDLRAEASSQFLTALLMVAPYAQEDVTIRIVGELRPFYVEITTRMMAQWGVTVENHEANARFIVRAGQRYAAQAAYGIEPDASSASYFFAAAAITGGQVCVPGLGPNALQGDVRFATEVLAEMGCIVTCDADGITVVGPPPGRLRGIDRDMSAISDTSLTLAAIAPFANSPTVVRNIAHSRLQECDRIHAVCTELAKLGVQVEERLDGFTIYPATRFTPAAIDTYHDHRVAMSFALIGLKTPGVTINDPGCVAKTFPDYWQRLKWLTGKD